MCWTLSSQSMVYSWLFLVSVKIVFFLYVLFLLLFEFGFRWKLNRKPLFYCVAAPACSDQFLKRWGGNFQGKECCCLRWESRTRKAKRGLGVRKTCSTILRRTDSSRLQAGYSAISALWFKFRKVEMKTVSGLERKTKPSHLNGAQHWGNPDKVTCF